MMKKRHKNYRLIRIHRSYTVEEITKLFGVHKNTVRSWLKDGLATIDDKRPMMIAGLDLVEFIKKCRTKNKHPCHPGELYCVKCRAQKFPAGGMADYLPVTEKFGNLIAICPDCDSIMNQRVSLSRIEAVCENIDITFPKALRHIVNRANPSVNSDFR